MSKIFNDPVYRDMQESEDAWLELAIEPFKFYLNDVLISLPSKIDVTFDMLAKEVNTNYNHYGTNLSVNEIVSKFIDDSLIHKLNGNERHIINSVFELNVKNDTILDMVNKVLSDPITVVKKFDMFPENEVKAIAAGLAIKHLNIEDTRHKHSEHISRINEISDLLGAKEYRQSRSISYKAGDIHGTLLRILVDDEWKIRDYELMKDVCIWISEYCNTGHLPALMNFTRLKCMTHKGNPIYSLEEIK